MQPKAYGYLDHLRNWIDLELVFKQNHWPRQLQIYLPAKCNFKCYYCAGRLSPKNYDSWEIKGLRLLSHLGNKILLHMYSGCCNEPTINPYLLDFMLMTKRNGSFYGLKTNGSMLSKLEKDHGFLTTLCKSSAFFDCYGVNHDFISVSLDAGLDISHSESKGIDPKVFHVVVDGIKMLCDIKGDRNYPAVRISYLLDDNNNSKQEIEKAIDIAGYTGVDSIRFSQPHPAYAEDADLANREWQEILNADEYYMDLFSGLESSEKPVVFYASPTPIDYKFRRCAHGYYQITLAHDGLIYKCPIAPSVNVKDLVLGEIPDNVDDFWEAICLNQLESFNPKVCYDNGMYCCRAAQAINSHYRKLI